MHNLRKLRDGKNTRTERGLQEKT